MDWIDLRRGGTPLYIEYGLTHTRNLTARDVRVRMLPRVELSLDLNGNLRTRNKSGNRYYDARELADGKMAGLKLVQIDDSYIFEGLLAALRRARRVPPHWSLVMELEGPHTFVVRPESPRTSHSLVMRVVKATA